MSEDNLISLADLSDLDVSEIAEVRFSNLPAGVYEFKVNGVPDLSEGTNQDDEKRFIAEFKFVVLECLSCLEKGVDKDSLVGRNHTEKKYIVPEKAEEGIGLIRSFVTDMGGDSAGKLGEVLSAAEGLIFKGKIVQQTDRIDKSRKYSRLQLDPVKK